MCRIFGVANAGKAAELIFLGLHAQQHGAKEYAGIVTTDNVNSFRHAGPGTAKEVFNKDTLNRLFGRWGIGHLRYSTVDDDPNKDNTQPVEEGGVALCHNGNLTNVKALKAEFGDDPLFRTSMDTEVLLKRYVRSKAADPLGKLTEALIGVEGSYSLLLMTKDIMIAARCPWGNRPLWMGKRNGEVFFASESVALDNVGVTESRELTSGEIVVVHNDLRVESFYFDGHDVAHQPLPHKRAHCVFELEYYAHPGSEIFGISVSLFRILMGKKLQQKYPSPIQQVVGIPDSSLFQAIGYAEADEHELVLGITRSHYGGRTFILPLQRLRVEEVSLKFTVIRGVIGRAITLIDDSIVRFTTMPGVIKLLRFAGVKEIHIRIASPPITHGCHYGVDFPSKGELIAADHTIKQIQSKADSESLEYATIQDLKQVLAEFPGVDPEDFCFACMDGKYPIPIPDFDPAA